MIFCSWVIVLSPFPVPEGRVAVPVRGENRARPRHPLRKPTTIVRLSSSYRRVYVRADVLCGDGQGPAGLSTVQEKHQAHGRKSPRADRPSVYLARDHKAGGSVEPGAPRMGQLL